MSNVIINDTSKIDCFAGRLKGTFQWIVSDNGTNNFPAKVIVKTNHGNGSLEEILSGNTTYTKKVGRATITVIISGWRVTKEMLSFHVKATIKVGLFSCTIMNKSLSGRRSGADDLIAFEGLHDELEAMS